MSEQRPDNPDDLEFLISRALDGDLSEGESRRLARALEGSEALRVEEGRYRLLHELIARWASRAAPDRDDEFAPTVLERTTLRPIESSKGDGVGADGLDALLSGFGEREPRVAWDRFSAEIAARVVAPSRSTFGISRVMRWTSGLAAAAVIGLVFILSVPSGLPPTSERLVVWVHKHTEVSDFEFETSGAPRIAPEGDHMTPHGAPAAATLTSNDAEQTIIWEGTTEQPVETTRRVSSRSGWAIVGVGSAPTRTIGGLP